MNPVLMESYTDFILDFDGVIKESVLVKGLCFADLFAPDAAKLRDAVIEHHQKNAGMPRHVKIPLYAKWAGASTSKRTIRVLLDRYSACCKEKVISSAWVPGAREFIQKCYADGKRLYLITATPRGEIIEILEQLQLIRYFSKVFGSEIDKCGAVESILTRFSERSTRFVYIGDGEVDRVAASTNSIDFVLRKAHYNGSVQAVHSGLSIGDFNESLE